MQPPPLKKVDHGPGKGICEGCVNWKAHGTGCWVYWEGKRVCSQFVNHTGDWRPGFKHAKKSDNFLL